MRRLTGLLAGMSLIGATMLSSGVASAQSSDATVTVIHGVPGVTVDVCADGKAAITGFTFDSQKTLSLPAGTYSLGIVKSGAACSSANYLATASASVTAGENATAIAYLNGDTGKPTLGLYANDPAAVTSGDGRLVLSHNADAPTVKVAAGSTTLAASLAPGDQAAVVVPAETYSGVDVDVASSGAAAISGASVDVKPGMDTIVYVVGSSSAKYSAIVQYVALSSMPTGIVTGNSPVSSHDAMPLFLGAALLGLAALGGGVSIRRLRTVKTDRL